MQIVAGSMREAFGVQQVRYNGIVEQDGSPTRPALKNVAKIDPEDASNTPGPNDLQRQPEGAKLKEDRAFALAAATLRQAMQDMPEISEMSKHIMVEETAAGLNIELVDQEGRSMFPDGAKDPYDRTRRIVQKLAVPLKALPNRVSIAGHTAASRTPPRRGYGPWELSADRANAIRQILEDEGLPGSHVSHGGRQGRQPAAVPRRSAHRGEPPRHHHAAARGAAAADRLQAVTWSPARPCGSGDPVLCQALDARLRGQERKERVDAAAECRRRSLILRLWFSPCLRWGAGWYKARHLQGMIAPPGQAGAFGPHERSPQRYRAVRRPGAGSCSDELLGADARQRRHRLWRHRDEPALRLPRGRDRRRRIRPGHARDRARRALHDPLGADPGGDRQIRADPAARRQ